MPVPELSPNLDIPLCVDLDGTLIRTDIFWLSISRFLLGNPLRAGLLFCWLLRGRPYAKEKLAQRDLIDVASLPYHQEFLALLQSEKKRGRQLILATASSHEIAKRINAHLNLFDQVFGTERDANLSGKNKLAKMQDLLPGRELIYAGNSFADLAVWRQTKYGIIVNASQAVRLQAGKITSVILEIK